MDLRLSEDRDRLPALLEAVSTYAASFLDQVGTARVAVPPVDVPPSSLPTTGLGAERAFERFRTCIAPSLAASVGPRHLGFVTGGATPAAVVGDWLVSVFDQNPISQLDGSTALRLERDTADMLQSLFGLPEQFWGTFVSGATMSNFVGLAIAREWLGRQQGVRVSEEGVGAMRRMSIFTATPHSSATKALSMLGLGRRTWQQVECLAGREAMDVSALDRRLAQNDGPTVVIASAGTVNTGDFDDFTELARLKEAYGFWLHVDAAFGGFASLSPRLRPLVEGWQCADSICVDLHKWLNVPYDSGITFTRHRELQFDVFSNVSAYLGQVAEDPEPIHLAPENSHRWRALPAWFSLTAYGRDGYREIVERDCRLARLLGDRIQNSAFFDLLAPVRLNIVCFATKNRGDCHRLIQAVRDGGSTFVTPTVLHQSPAIRAAFSNWRTTEEDLKIAWEALVKGAEALSANA